jgi:hypothetical protein
MGCGLGRIVGRSGRVLGMVFSGVVPWAGLVQILDF